LENEVIGPSDVLCVPDNTFAIVGTAEDSVIILDMGGLADQAGYDLVYYEFWGPHKGPGHTPGILMDPVQIDVAQATQTGEPDSTTWRTILIWGDDNISNNGSIPPQYAIDGESADDPIAAVDLYAGSDFNGDGVIDETDGSGVAIDIGESSGTVWRFVRIRRFPPGSATDPSEAAEIDALETLNE
jgi:hypothetical protein